MLQDDINGLYVIGKMALTDKIGMKEERKITWKGFTTEGAEDYS